MKSGIALNAYVAAGVQLVSTLVIVPVVPVTVVVLQLVIPELSKPPPFPGLPNAKFATLPRAAKVVWGFSTEAPTHKRLPKFWTKRIPYCRAQLKPTVYCGSIVMGRASVRLSRPCLVSVTKLHICPPVRLHPPEDTCPHTWRWRRA